MSAPHAPTRLHSPRVPNGHLCRLLDILTEGVALCAADGRITHRNRAIVRMLASASGDLWLTAAIEQAAVSAVRSGLPFFAAVSGEPLGRAPLPHPHTAGPRYELHATVLGETWLGADTAVGVVVRRALGDTLTADELRARFGLTPREVEVAWLLARGDSNAAVACALGVSPCTARHYTEHTLGKLGVRSRAQVAASIRRSAAADPQHWERVSDEPRGSTWPLPHPRTRPPPSPPSRNSRR